MEHFPTEDELLLHEEFVRIEASGNQLYLPSTRVEFLLEAILNASIPNACYYGGWKPDAVRHFTAVPETARVCDRKLIEEPSLAEQVKNDPKLAKAGITIRKVDKRTKLTQKYGESKPCKFYSNPDKPCSLLTLPST